MTCRGHLANEILFLIFGTVLKYHNLKYVFLRYWFLIFGAVLKYHYLSNFLLFRMLPHAQWDGSLLAKYWFMPPRKDLFCRGYVRLSYTSLRMCMVDLKITNLKGSFSPKRPKLTFNSNETGLFSLIIIIIIIPSVDCL